MGLGPIATPLHASYTCDNAEGRPLPGPPLRLDRCGNALSAQGVSLRLEINRRNLGRNIRRAREERDISQRIFARMIGVSQAYLSSVEHGEKNIGFNNLCKIADGLGLIIGELVEGVMPKDLIPKQIKNH
ncbi:MAG TPA: helix-turn-helix domain-containing protein [Candidatus Olsenella avicola]|nr:helix-turn-helix domain-containing protein [Candidatus Olsenella avicola]